MTTLAKAFLDSDQDIQGNEALRVGWNWAHDFVHKRLTYPLSGGDEDLIAERFVFDVDAPHFVSDLCAAGSLAWSAISETISLPDAPIWIEYPMTYGDSAPGRLGFMIDRVHDGVAISNPQIAMVAVGQSANSPAIPIAFWTVQDFPYLAGTKMMPVFWLDKVGEAMGSEGTNGMVEYMQEVACCFFLLQTPKVVELRKAGFGPRKAKIQRATGKPFVELHHVNIRIGIPEVRYEGRGAGTGEGREGGVKRHRVLPHFRTYGRKAGKPRAKLVDTFWRGDIKKGIIIHEKRAKLPETPSG